MGDIALTVDSELMVAHVQGVTEEGIEFVDAYSSDVLIAVDMGRIMVPQDAVTALSEAAQAQGLTIA